MIFSEALVAGRCSSNRYTFTLVDSCGLSMHRAQVWSRLTTPRAYGSGDTLRVQTVHGRELASPNLSLATCFPNTIGRDKTWAWISLSGFEVGSRVVTGQGVLNSISKARTTSEDERVCVLTRGSVASTRTWRRVKCHRMDTREIRA